MNIVKKLSLEKEVNVNASEFTLRDGLCVLDMISNGAVIAVKYDEGYSVFVDFRIDAEGVHIDTKGFENEFYTGIKYYSYIYDVDHVITFILIRDEIKCKTCGNYMDMDLFRETHKHECYACRDERIMDELKKACNEKSTRDEWYVASFVMPDGTRVYWGYDTDMCIQKTGTWEHAIKIPEEKHIEVYEFLKQKHHQFDVKMYKVAVMNIDMT